MSRIPQLAENDGLGAAAPRAGAAPRGQPARWLPTVDEAYRQMLAAIERACFSIRFEFYIFRAGDPGDRFREALVAAARRGVRVRVLLDDFGSGDLHRDYWDRLRAAGGEMQWFNRRPLLRLPVRNHQKLVVVDDAVGFVGGFNLAPEYAGDGVESGWRDLGLMLSGSLVSGLASAFDAMWQHRDFKGYRAIRALGSRWRHRLRRASNSMLALTGPAFGRNTFQEMVIKDILAARDVRIIAAYFTPSLRLRRALRRVVRSGGRVRVILAGKTDVPMVQAAGRTFYRRLLRAGIELAEYQPQVLHAKLVLADDVVFAGSANLDVRSLTVNYELMVRLADRGLAEGGRAIFDADWARSRPILREEWRRTRTWADKLYGAAARFCLTKIDPWFARVRLRNLA
ncbi:MAG TPA: phospholipase D-like domain-containing protein [Opitutaceae bacterium]|nr:phospholipase D-like domain-containing protein [Opitutaceae bacterium]